MKDREKFIDKLSQKERSKFIQVVKQIRAGEYT